MNGKKQKPALLYDRIQDLILIPIRADGARPLHRVHFDQPFFRKDKIMKTRNDLLCVFIAMTISICSMMLFAAPMGTAFTYQGRLMDNDTPAEGIYEMEFKLFDSIADPNQLGFTISFRSLEVTDGYFTAALDFGSSVFNGDARWLEIGVRPTGTADPFETLSPRQEITAGPYALYSLQTHGIFVDDLSNVGVGTQSPAGKLHVDGGKATSGNWGADLVFKAQDGGDGWAMQNNGAPGGDIILLPGEGGEEIGAGSPGPDGNVGIGTTIPTTKLDVLGTVTATAFVGDGSNLSGIVIDSGWTISGNDIYSSLSGNVGIGTTSPGTKLHIEGGSDASLGGGGFLVAGSVSSTNMVLDNNEIIARNNGAAAKLYLNNGSGNVVVSVLEITGGSDLAEPFKVAGAESVEPGMVVAIDPENPGTTADSKQSLRPHRRRDRQRSQRDQSGHDNESGRYIGRRFYPRGTDRACLCQGGCIKRIH